MSVYYELCREIFEILDQQPNVYQSPFGGRWCFANAGIISDGFESKEQAEIAALKQIISAVKERLD